MLAQFSVRPYFIEVLKAPEWSLNGEQIRIHESRLLEFSGQLLRVVEVSPREVDGILGRILVPTGREILPNDRDEARVVNEAPKEAVKQ